MHSPFTHLCWLPLLGIVLLAGCPGGQTPVEIIIDNADGAPAVNVVAGTWDTANTTDGTGSWGSDFLYHFADRAPVAIVRYTPTITTAGRYTVSIYWSADPNRTIDQPVIVHDANGNTTYHVNLQQNGSQWYVLGQHTFSAGTAGYVEFNTDTDDGFCNADAVRFASAF